MKNLEGDDLRREIDEALAEIDRTENEVLELFRELLGPQAARRVADYMRAKAGEPNLETLRRAARPGPSTAPPETP